MRNLRYVALQSLQKVVRFDLQSVQKHKAIILECLRVIDSQNFANMIGK
jgi:Adaptin N terminal region.